MDKAILATEIQEFIAKNTKADLAKLALQKNPFPAVEWKEILNQIVCKQRAESKLPTWFQTENIIYPAKISIEQTSSEKTAQYKSQLVSGENLIDLTGGFGVDDFYFSKTIKQVTHCEINSELSGIVAHNTKRLKLKNIHCINGDSLDILKQLNKKFDWIYIDPSRRNDAKGKVFMLKDCLPNVPDLLDFYFEFSSNIMVKTAPILDITAGITELKNIAEIHIVAIENEVKELLWILKKNTKNLIKIKTVNLLKNNQQAFSFVLNQENNFVPFSLPKKYLFEPNAPIMKSSGFDVIPTRFAVEKLHQHSHLYTADYLIDFPGRIFEIRQTIGYSKNEMKNFLENKKANITTRNFPDTVEIIRKKWKIKDGGDLYCFFTTDLNNDKIVLLCSKIN